MCFRLIEAKRAQHPVLLLCEVLGVSRAGCYAWKQRPVSARRRRDVELLDQIRAVHADSKATYGWPRVHAELRHQGIRASRKRIARLMRDAGLSGMVRRRRGRTTIRVPGVATAPDLVRRDFAPTAPNRPSGRRLHGDRDLGGSGQYVSLIFGQTARAAGIAVSMGAKGCALDNAVCQAFFATLKKELTRRRSWPTRRELETAVFARIEGRYNRRRLPPRSAIARPRPSKAELPSRTGPVSPLRGSHTHKR